MNYELTASSWGEEEITAIKAIIARGQYTMGDAVEKFEQLFADKFGSCYGVMVNSGSSANLLTIAALCYKKKAPLKAGDEIIVPSVSWSTTYFPVHQYGMKLVFIDIDLETLNINPDHLQSAISPKTRAVLVPHILGNPADLGRIQAFCEEHGLYLIEDNCESMGAKWNDKATGTFGICGTFSTFFSHHITTMEGGMILTDDEEIYHILLSLRSHGWTRHLPKENRLCKKNDNPFYESFRFILPGYNLRPLEMSGAVGLEQLKKFNDFLSMRRNNAEYFIEKFGSDERFILQKENGYSSWFGFAMSVAYSSGISRNSIVRTLQDACIDVRPIVSGNFLANDVIRHINHRVVGEHPDAKYIHENGFFVGNHHLDIRDKIDYLHQILMTV